jgi:hypothetical protein
MFNFRCVIMLERVHQAMARIGLKQEGTTKYPRVPPMPEPVSGPALVSPCGDVV